MAMEVVVETARMMGADRLVPIVSSHIDGCLYHGDAGVLYCEKLADGGARVAVPATTNVGSLNLLKASQVKLPKAQREMAYRLMMAHQRMGCTPSWTCAPYQTQARPCAGPADRLGRIERGRLRQHGPRVREQTATATSWTSPARSRGARPTTGCTAQSGARRGCCSRFRGCRRLCCVKTRSSPCSAPWWGGTPVTPSAVIDGIPGPVREDRLKSFCAAAAATGAVALTHIVGVTPEAPDVVTALGGASPEETVQVTREMVVDTRDRLSLAGPGPIDCVSLGSPHFSEDECRTVLALAEGGRFRVPVYVCLGRHTLDGLRADGAYEALQGLGVEFVVDTCVVVTAILPPRPWRDDDQLGQVRLLRLRQHRVQAGVRHAVGLHPERPGRKGRARPGDLGMSWRADVLLGGRASGTVLRMDAPVSFWGGISPATSEVVLAGHPQRGERIAERVLVLPRPIGSSSSASVILELLRKGLGPRALILGVRDAILPIGVLVARQMNWDVIPVLVMVDSPFQTGDMLRIDEDGAIEAGS